MEKKQVILVDENDVPRGTMEKMEAHKKEELHRAFSIFVFNSKYELLTSSCLFHFCFQLQV